MGIQLNWLGAVQVGRGLVATWFESVKAWFSLVATWFWWVRGWLWLGCTGHVHAWLTALGLGKKL